jgi:hypothetical protein
VKPIEPDMVEKEGRRRRRRRRRGEVVVRV